MTTWPYMVDYLLQIMTQIKGKLFYFKGCYILFIFRTNLVDSGKNSLYWETRDRNNSAGRYR